MYVCALRYFTETRLDTCYLCCGIGAAYTSFCTHVPIIRNMLQCTHCALYPQTCSESHARLALPHAGDVVLRVSAPMPELVLGRSGAVVRYRGSWPAWLDAPCRRSRSRSRSAYMLIVRCHAATWAHGAMPMPGRHVGGYLHGYLLTIGG